MTSQRLLFAVLSSLLIVGIQAETLYTVCYNNPNYYLSSLDPTTGALTHLSQLDADTASRLNTASGFGIHLHIDGLFYFAFSDFVTPYYGAGTLVRQFQISQAGTLVPNFNAAHFDKMFTPQMGAALTGDCGGGEYSLSESG